MELRGKPVADQIMEESIKKIKELRKKNILPKLAIVRLGKNPGDISYEKSILKYNENIGLETEVIEMDRKVTSEELLRQIDIMNKDDKIHGILVFRPLPLGVDLARVSESISLKKDVDGMNPQNLLALFLGSKTLYEPSTARAVMELLRFYNLELKGKKVAIINRSEVVGKPLAMMFLREDATVTICHSKTENLREITRTSDIVVTAVGKAKLLDRTYFNKDSIVIDVGMSLDGEGSLSGDVNYNEVKDFVKMLTPVPGGVGRITTAVLMKQLIDNIG